MIKEGVNFPWLASAADKPEVTEFHFPLPCSVLATHPTTANSSVTQKSAQKPDLIVWEAMSSPRIMQTSKLLLNHIDCSDSAMCWQV